MNAILRATAVAMCLGILVGANPPATQVLLLDTRQLIEGTIEPTGDGYQVRREDGTTLIPRNRVLAVCRNRVAAYRILADRIGANDAVERLKLAQWCHNNGLPDQAIAEAKTAVILRPEHKESLRLLRHYEQSARAPAAPEAVKPVSATLPVPETVDCSPEALQHYCTRVQPVLLNACLGCHAAATNFRLRRNSSSRGDTFQNLAAAMTQVNRAKPAASPLLQKALTAHGGTAVPPLRDRGTPAYQQLEVWVQMLAADASTTPLPDGVPEAKSTSAFGADKPEPKNDGPKDPFDPAEFNKPKPKG